MITVVRGRPTEAELAAVVTAFVVVARSCATDRDRGAGAATGSAVRRARWTAPAERYRAPHSWQS